MNLIAKNVRCLWLILSVLGVMACSSLQTDIYVDKIDFSENITGYEKRFAVLDGTEKRGEDECTSLIADIEVALADSSLTNAARARLFALEGLSYLFIGNESKAKTLYEASVDSYKGDVRGVILSSRLGIIKNLSAKVGESSEPALIKIEVALTSFDKGNYINSVALFDEAFLSLDTSYRDAYSEKRDFAWNASQSAGEAGSSFAKYKKITVGQMLMLVNESSDILITVTNGKKMSSGELYKKACGAGLLDCATVKQDPKSFVKEKDTVTRFIAARFLWNAWNKKRNSSNFRKYSERYLKAGIDSPVPDVAITNPDFDAVLGCVENEIINLADGRNFEGNRLISAIELEQAVKNIK